MGRPAASAEVQRSGRSAPVRRSKVAAFEACPARVGALSPARTRGACRSPGSTRMTWRSPLASRWNCSRVWPGLGRAFVFSLRVQRPVLDGRVVGQRERARVGLVGIVEDLHRHPLLVGRHDDEAHVEVVLERLVRADATRSSRAESGCTGSAGDVLVPGVVRREDLERGQDRRPPRGCRTSPAS